jgi:hypothetical protein
MSVPRSGAALIILATQFRNAMNLPLAACRLATELLFAI